MIVPALSPSSWGLVFALTAAVLLWLLSLRLKDASIVDIFWGPGIAGVVDIAAAITGQARQIGGQITAAIAVDKGLDLFGQFGGHPFIGINR
jgi:steroid 5-alpha reductase family enzyme